MAGGAQNVKEEMSRLRPSRRCCRLAELSSLMHMEGTYTIRGEGGHLFVTESADICTARKIYGLLHTLFDLETYVLTVTRSSPSKATAYRIELYDQPGFHQALNELGVLDSSLNPEPTVPKRLTRRDCCVAAALRGAFLGGGYVSRPLGPADFEITFSTGDAAREFEELFRRKGLVCGTRIRRGHRVLYLKSREEISSFLAVAGAHAAHLEWESRTIINSTKNDVNRLVNCDAANAGRLAEASVRQREVVEKLASAGLLEGTPAELSDTARARLASPQASLAEIGRMLDPPVSKAVVQSRFRKLALMLEEAEGALEKGIAPGENACGHRS